MKETEIHRLWVTEWAIIEEMSFLCNKHRRWWSLIKYFNIFVTYNISDPLIVVSLLHIHECCYFYLKYSSDVSWMCSVGTCIVYALILDYIVPHFVK